MNMKKYFSYLVAFVVIALSYQNCGGGGGGASFSEAPASSGGDIIPIPNTKTTSVQRSSRVVENLVSCLGLEKANDALGDAWSANRGTISSEGLANTMNQPMAKAMITVAAEACAQRVGKDRAHDNANAANRLIFKEIDFDDNELQNLNMAPAIKRLSRSCWGRSPSSEELQLIVSQTEQAFSSENNGRGQLDRKLIYMCTAMAASFSTYEM